MRSVLFVFIVSESQEPVMFQFWEMILWNANPDDFVFKKVMCNVVLVYLELQICFGEILGELYIKKFDCFVISCLLFSSVNCPLVFTYPVVMLRSFSYFDKQTSV